MSRDFFLCVKQAETRIFLDFSENKLLDTVVRHRLNCEKSLKLEYKLLA